MKVSKLFVGILFVLNIFPMDGQGQTKLWNKPERVEWFRSLGLGMFIHWSYDSQLGMVISHSAVGASVDYLDRFFNVLPKSFNPKKFDPSDWAVLAKLAGMKYVVFTTKHHSGFCMFDSRTNAFNIMNTPYGRDIVAQVAKAFREQGIAVGFYFSPDDFYVLYKQGTLISRGRPEVDPINNAGLMENNKAQLQELLTNYGPVDILFLDGVPDGLRDLAWELQPDIVVTRGALETPEQEIPGKGITQPWEACFTMGTQWQYKPTNEEYKSGGDLIQMFIEIRAKGGNFLLNVGPKPDGELPIEQEERLRELALWNFINGEAMYDIQPWIVTNEENIWFTKKKDSNTVYAIITGERDWKLGEWKIITLKSVEISEGSQISVLGQKILQ